MCENGFIVLVKNNADWMSRLKTLKPQSSRHQVTSSEFHSGFTFSFFLPQSTVLFLCQVKFPAVLGLPPSVCLFSYPRGPKEECSLLFLKSFKKKATGLVKFFKAFHLLLENISYS